MRFFIVPLTTYLLSVAGSAVAINVDAALHCLSVEVYGWGWQTRSCSTDSSISFWRRGSAWNNPDHCYDACAGELGRQIGAGVGNAECYRKVVAAECWMGYNS